MCTPSSTDPCGTAEPNKPNDSAVLDRFSSNGLDRDRREPAAVAPGELFEAQGELGLNALSEVLSPADSPRGCSLSNLEESVPRIAFQESEPMPNVVDRKVVCL